MNDRDELMGSQEASPKTEPVVETTRTAPEATAPGPASVEAKIDLNTATDEELRQLPGIGKVLAARIVNYREEIHPFEETIEIVAVRGISEPMYAKFSDRLTVGPIGEAQAEVEAEIRELPLREPEMDESAGDPALPSSPVEEEVPISPPTPAPPPVAAPRAGWGRFLFVGLVSATAGAILALLVLLGLNGTLDYLGGNALRPVWTQAGEIEDRMDLLSMDLTLVRGRLEAVQDLNLRLDDAEASIRQLKDSLVAAQVEMDDLSFTLNAMRSEMTNLREDLDGMAGQVGTLRQRADLAEEQLAILNEDLQALGVVVDRFDTFLGGLRALLNESLGPPTPTPWVTITPGTSNAMTPYPPIITVIPMTTPTATPSP